jgi:hypothetical protein
VAGIVVDESLHVDRCVLGEPFLRVALCKRRKLKRIDLFETL